MDKLCYRCSLYLPTLSRSGISHKRSGCSRHPKAHVLFYMLPQCSCFCCLFWSQICTCPCFQASTATSTPTPLYVPAVLSEHPFATMPFSVHLYAAASLGNPGPVLYCLAITLPMLSAFDTSGHLYVHSVPSGQLEVCLSPMVTLKALSMNLVADIPAQQSIIL